MNKENLLSLLDEYKETKKCLEMGIQWLEDKDYAKGKLEVIDLLIKDLELLITQSEI